MLRLTRFDPGMAPHYRACIRQPTRHLPRAVCENYSARIILFLRTFQAFR